MRFDLLRCDNKVVEWDGTDGEDAARRYVDAMRVAGSPDGGGIIGTRAARGPSISVLGPKGRIVG
jgi:hypothetical protein